MSTNTNSPLLQEVHTRSRSLLHACLAAHVHATALSPHPRAQMHNHSQHTLETLSQQRINQATRTEYERLWREKAHMELEQETEESLYDQIDNLNKQLREVYYQRRREAALISSIHDSMVITEALYASENNETNVLSEQIFRRDDHCSHALKLSDRRRELEDELESINAQIERFDRDIVPGLLRCECFMSTHPFFECLIV
eukprot:m.140450 g.140450  ORF g.140450 m.140450 type:complete len:200 (+) comp15962_c1_seq1:118-717(+)